MGSGFLRFIFGEPASPHVPARVRAAIDKQDRQSERLIAWAQLVVVLFFVALYSLSPKTSAGTPFEPVPVVLMIYGGFATARLWLAHLHHYPFGLVIPLVVADVGLLMALIWSFHLQYGQPPAFYLKAPTLLYVFIFIALRALRFAPGSLIAAGAAGAAGWLVLTAYALFAAGPDPVVTRSYVAYLTSNVVLIGAELDKVICIGLVTAILAVALVRARRLLLRAVGDAVVAADLTRFVAPEIASQVRSAEAAIQPGDGEIKTATILFADLEAFSTLAERVAPRQLLAILNEYLGEVGAILSDHGGDLTFVQGDGFMATFNAATPNTDHARAALSAGKALQAMLATRRFGHGEALRARIGINTGPLIVGAVGNAERLLVTVYGDNVNVASRLEQLNKTYGTRILVTERTVFEAGAATDDGLRPIATVAIRGRSEPVAVFAIDAADRHPETTPITQPAPNDGRGP